MITLPLALAALSAGAIGGVHCVGMCGGISTLLSKSGIAGRKVIAIASVGESACSANSTAKNLRYQVLLHGGRLFTYMLIGAVFGGLGGAGVLFKPYLPVQQILYVIGNLALVLLGLRLLGLKSAVSFMNGFGDLVQRFAHAILPGIRQSSPFPFLPRIRPSSPGPVRWSGTEPRRRPWSP